VYAPPRRAAPERKTSEERLRAAVPPSSASCLGWIILYTFYVLDPIVGSSVVAATETAEKVAVTKHAAYKEFDKQARGKAVIEF
jgi:hypothetical protein